MLNLKGTAMEEESKCIKTLNIRTQTELIQSMNRECLCTCAYKLTVELSL